LLLHVSHKFAKAFALQLPDWTKLGEIRRTEGQTVSKRALEVLLEEELGCVRCHKQKCNRERIPWASRLRIWKYAPGRWKY